MTDIRLEREAIALFEQLLDLPEGEREARLAKEAAARPELLSRVAAMMEADRRANLRTGAALDNADGEAMPERIGAYRITELIGRGGMGSVYRGERVTGDFSHVVAIKVIKPGLLSEALVERFLRERQVLAGLSHPNIAQLYDGGETEAGSPYFVMEHVDGLPLLQWAEKNNPPRDARVRLFGDICRAVAFAHGNLVVHRDLTPSNVLVTREGMAKLIDFGIAKPADLNNAPREAPSIGSLSLTPGYAAPERMVSASVTTAADIYSLGKLLAKLIPPGPDDRELLAIVARATGDDPEDRYPTADALGADVAAWHAGLPVAAMEGGKRYAAAKFVRRHRWGVAAAALSVLLLVGAFAVSASSWYRAEEARRAEAERFEELRSLAGFMLRELDGRLARVVGNTAARAELADRAQTYLSALASSPDAPDDLKLEAARGFITLARAQGVPTQPNLGRTEQARANLASAIALLRETGEPSAGAPDLVEALAAFAMIQAHIDADMEAANTSLAEAAKVLDATPEAGRDARWHQARRRLRHGQLEMTALNVEPDEMLRLVGLLESEIGQWPEAMRNSRNAEFDRAIAAYQRGMRGYMIDELEKSVAELRRSERILAALDRALPNDPVTLYALMWTAYLGYGSASGLPWADAEADRFLDLAIRTNDRLIAIEANDQSLRSFGGNLRQSQSQALSDKGSHARAIETQREVIALYESALGPERKAITLNRLAIAQLTMGDIARAANDRRLACGAYAAARTHIAELDKRKELLGFVEEHRDKLEGHRKGC